MESLGRSVAIDGDTIVTEPPSTAPPGPGAVYVFRRRWRRHARRGGQAGGFRRRGGRLVRLVVAIDGDTVVIGAYARTARGSARLPHGGRGATYGQVAKLTGSDVMSVDYFGSSVAIDGDTVIDRQGLCHLGATDGGATYGQVAKLTASDGAAGDYFGISVASPAPPLWSGQLEMPPTSLTSDDGASYAQVAKLTGPDSFGGPWPSTATPSDRGQQRPRRRLLRGLGHVYRTSDGWDTHTQIKLTASDGAAVTPGSSVHRRHHRRGRCRPRRDAGFWSGSVYVQHDRRRRHVRRWPS